MCLKLKVKDKTKKFEDYYQKDNELFVIECIKKHRLKKLCFKNKKSKNRSINYHKVFL